MPLWFKHDPLAPIRREFSDLSKNNLLIANFQIWWAYSMSLVRHQQHAIHSNLFSSNISKSTRRSTSRHCKWSPSSRSRCLLKCFGKDLIIIALTRESPGLPGQNRGTDRACQINKPPFMGASWNFKILAFNGTSQKVRTVKLNSLLHRTQFNAHNKFPLWRHIF